MVDGFGQVLQRAYGFRKAKYNLVLQLDDDIWLDKFCLQKLVKSLLDKDEKCCVAPKIIDRNNNNKNVLKKDSKNYGTVSKTGEAVSVPINFKSEKLFLVDWVPGGCVLHTKQNLILDNFFPYKGKAYCEDLIHSFLLNQNKVKLYINTNLYCSTDLEITRLPSIKYFFNQLKDDFRARSYFMKKFKIYSNKILIYYSKRIISYIFKSVFCKFI